MAHASKLDREISSEFQNDWMGLYYQALEIRARIMEQKDSDILEIEEYEDLPIGTNNEAIMKVRFGQAFLEK